MVDSHKPCQHILAAHALCVPAVIATEHKSLAVNPYKPVYNTAPLIDKQINLATLQTAFNSSQLNTIAAAIYHRQHTAAAKGNGHRQPLRETFLHLVDYEAVGFIGYH